MPRPRIGDIPLAFSTGVRLDLRDRQQLEQLALKKQITRNALIRAVIREFLSQHYKMEPAES